jgi:hypothetical protein
MLIEKLFLGDNHLLIMNYELDLVFFFNA